MTVSNRPKSIAASVARPDSPLANPLNISFRLNAFNQKPNVTLLDVENLTIGELFQLVDKQNHLELQFYEVASSTTITTTPHDFKAGDMLQVVMPTAPIHPDAKPKKIVLLRMLRQS